MKKKSTFKHIVDARMFAVMEHVIASKIQGIATISDRIQHPTLTETQVFMRIPQTFFWDFSL